MDVWKLSVAFADESPDQGVGSAQGALEVPTSLHSPGRPKALDKGIVAKSYRIWGFLS